MKTVSLPDLPYDYKALEPVISAETLRRHHDKHHLAYVNGTNAALEKLNKYQSEGGEIDIKAVLRDLSFNYNGHKLHDIFWKIMRPPQENNEPNDRLKSILAAEFASWESFMKEFSAAAVAVEGSGWAMLSKTADGLAINQVEKHNALCLAGSQAILVLDVWEHAYYLDYQNDRKTYVEKWWQVVNWEEVAKRLG
ncbi:superoxide dismutase [Patescibacteria group bacterium]|nr:superoxide dismutase [Patescibacteria group bacterium]